MKQYNLQYLPLAEQGLSEIIDYIHTLEEYISMLLKKENESHFGTPFQWTFASGRKGKDIQLKCKIIK